MPKYLLCPRVSLSAWPMLRECQDSARQEAGRGCSWKWNVVRQAALLWIESISKPVVLSQARFQLSLSGVLLSRAPSTAVIPNLFPSLRLSQSLTFSERH